MKIQEQLNKYNAIWLSLPDCHDLTLKKKSHEEHQQKLKRHSQHSQHFEIQFHLLSIMQCTLARIILSKIVFISLQDFQTWYSIPKRV